MVSRTTPSKAEEGCDRRDGPGVRRQRDDQGVGEGLNSYVRVPCRDLGNESVVTGSPSSQTPKSM